LQFFILILFVILYLICNLLYFRPFRFHSEFLCGRVERWWKSTYIWRMEKGIIQ